MPAQATRTWELRDARDRDIGRIAVERVEGDCAYGRFTPGRDYAAVEPLFQKFEEAVEAQALSVLDELDTRIAALGLRLAEGQNGSVGREVRDVQIWSTGDATFRTDRASELASTNGVEGG